MKKIVVIFGGKSPEHDVSVITGVMTVNALKEKYEVYPVYALKSGEFLFDKTFDDVKNVVDKNFKKAKKVFFMPSDSNIYAIKGKKIKSLGAISCIVNCMHGGIGENGSRDVATFDYEVAKARHIAQERCDLVADLLHGRDLRGVGVDFGCAYAFARRLAADVVGDRAVLGTALDLNGRRKCRDRVGIVGIDLPDKRLPSHDAVESTRVDMKEAKLLADNARHGALASAAWSVYCDYP